MKISYTLDNGKTWHDCDGIIVQVDEQPIPGEDVDGEVLFNFTHEGLIIDVWAEGSFNAGTSSEMYGDIVARLCEENS